LDADFPNKEQNSAKNKQTPDKTTDLKTRWNLAERRRNAKFKV
jgi:hypothetical protein